MTKTADVKDVAANFSKWLKEVAAGHEVVVTENNRPVARIVSPAEAGLEKAPTSQQGPASKDTKPRNSASDFVAWIRTNAHKGRPRSHQPVSQSELADELFNRE